MRNDFSRPPALWTTASVPNARDIQVWDHNQYSGVDGDHGGTWAPVTPIGIGNQGVQLASGSQMLGGFESRLGGRFVLGTADFPSFVTGQARTVTFPIRGINDTSPSLATSVGVRYRKSTKVLLVGGAGAVLRAGWTNPQATTIAFPIEPRYMHSGATISSIALYAFLSAPPVVPSIVQQVHLFDATARVDYTPFPVFWQPSHTYAANVTVIPNGFTAQNGLYFTSSGSGTSGSSQPAWNHSIGGGTFDNGINWITQGFAGTVVDPTSYSNAALYNAGGIHVMKLTPFPSGTPLVVSKGGEYLLAIVQDGNPWVYTACQINYTSIADFRFE